MTKLLQPRLVGTSGETNTNSLISFVLTEDHIKLTARLGAVTWSWSSKPDLTVKQKINMITWPHPIWPHPIWPHQNQSLKLTFSFDWTLNYLSKYRNAQTKQLSHPLPVLRAREIDTWSRGQEYQSLLRRWSLV